MVQSIGNTCMIIQMDIVGVWICHAPISFTKMSIAGPAILTSKRVEHGAAMAAKRRGIAMCNTKKMIGSHTNRNVAQNIKDNNLQ
jgi:hypothetical protein